MASDQIEYCGECPHYNACKKLAEKGKLEKCKLDKKER